MTVETTDIKQQFTLNQVTKQFDFTFRALTSTPTDIKATALTGSTETLLTYTTDYTVTISTDGIGGNLWLVDETAVSKGTLTIYRDTTDKQESDYDDFNQFPADTLETDLDKRTMKSQEQEEAIDRSLKLPISVTGVDAELAIPVASQVIGWDSAGTALTNYDNAATSVTAAASYATTSLNASTASASSSTTASSYATTSLDQAAIATSESTTASNSATVATSESTTAGSYATIAISSGVPTITTGSAGKILRVNTGETAYEIASNLTTLTLTHAVITGLTTTSISLSELSLSTLTVGTISVTNATISGTMATGTLSVANTIYTGALCRIKTGTYTGDGNVTLAITGVGFQPRYVKIWLKQTTDGGAVSLFESTPEINADAANYSVQHTSAGAHAGYFNTIHAFGADGFTVGDDSANADPNANTQIYNYLCLG